VTERMNPATFRKTTPRIYSSVPVRFKVDPSIEDPVTMNDPYSPSHSIPPIAARIGDYYGSKTRKTVTEAIEYAPGEKPWLVAASYFFSFWRCSLETCIKGEFNFKYNMILILLSRS